MKNDIDNQLKEWWTERRRHEGLPELQQKISAAVREGDSAEGLTLEFESASHSFRRTGYILAAAAVLIIGLFVGRWTTNNNGSFETNGYLATAEVSGQELASGARVFEEAARLFDKRLKWIVESNGDVGMGIDSSAGAEVDDAQPAFVRVLVLERRDGEEEWRHSWKADVVIRGEEVAQISTNGDGKNSLTLWVYPVGDDRLLVDTAMVLGGKVHLGSGSSNLLVNGEPTQISTLRRGKVEYRVLQTVKMIQQEGRGA